MGPVVKKPEDDPLYQSVVQPPDPGWKMRNAAIGGAVQKMLSEPGMVPKIPFLDFQNSSSPENVNAFRSQQEPSIAGPIDFSPKSYHEKRSEDALDNYSKSKLGTTDQQYETLKEAGQTIDDPLNFIGPVDSAVVPLWKKVARREAEFKSGLAPVKRLEGPAEEVANRIKARDVHFHATSESSMPKIIESGAIMPNELLHQGQGYKASQEAIAKKAAEYKAAKQAKSAGKPIGPLVDQPQPPTAMDLLKQHDELDAAYNKESASFKEYMKKHPDYEGWEWPEEFFGSHSHEPETVKSGQKYIELHKAINDWYNKYDFGKIKAKAGLESVQSKDWVPQKGTLPAYDDKGNHPITDVKHDPLNQYAVGKAPDGKYYTYSVNTYIQPGGAPASTYDKHWISQGKGSKTAAEEQSKFAKWHKDWKGTEIGEPNINKDIVGVSTSRIPRVMPKQSKAISMELDPTKMPKNRPYSETDMGYGKTRSVNSWQMPEMDELLHTHLDQDELQQFDEATKKYKDWVSSPGHNPYDHDIDAAYEKIEELKELAKERWKQSAQKTKMNERFEFENRTFGKPIDWSAVNRILIDRSALRDTERYHAPWPNITHGAAFEDTYPGWVAKHGTPEDKAKLAELDDKIDKSSYLDPDFTKHVDAKWKFLGEAIGRYRKQMEAAHGPEKKIVEKLRSYLGPDFPIDVYDTGKEMHRHRVERFKGQTEALKGKTVSPLAEHEKRLGQGILDKIVKAQTPIPVEKLVESTENSPRAIAGELLSGKKQVPPETQTVWQQILQQILGNK